MNKFPEGFQEWTGSPATSNTLNGFQEWAGGDIAGPAKAEDTRRPASSDQDPPRNPASVDEFVQQISPIAQRIAQKIGAPVDAVIGQLGLETGWGKSVIPGTNNYGNIKDTSGKGVAATDNMTGSRDRYRQYASAEEFADDYVKLVGTNPRYKGAVGAKDAQVFFTGLKQGGYAEDPNYVQSGVAASRTAAESLKKAGFKQESASLPDMTGIPKWSEISTSEKYAKLPDAEKSRMKNAYFDELIAPYVAAEGLDVSAEKAKFIGVEKKEEPGLISRASDAAAGVFKAMNPFSPTPGLMDGVSQTVRQENTDRFNLPLSADTRAKLDYQYEKSTPEQRAQLGKADGVVGMYFTERNKQHAERDSRTQPPSDVISGPASTDIADPRFEARTRQLIRSGMTAEGATTYARTEMRMGMNPGGMKPGSATESDFDFELQDRFKNAPAVIRGAAKGYQGYKQGYLGILQAAADAVGADELSEKFAKGSKDAQGAIDAVGENKAGQVFEGAITSIAQQMPSLIGGALTGSEALVLGSMAVQSFGQEYAQGRMQNLNGGDAAKRASLFAAFEVVGEKFGLGNTLKAMRMSAAGAPTKDLAMELSKALIKETPGELITTTGQFATDKVSSFGLNQEAGMAEYLSQVGDTIDQTVMQSALMISGTGGVSTTARHLQNRSNNGAQLSEIYANDARDRSLSKWESNPLVRPTQSPQAAPQSPQAAPQSPQAHPTSQVADAVVRDLAAAAGMDVESLIPTKTLPVQPADVEPIAAVAEAQGDSGIADQSANPESRELELWLKSSDSGLTPDEQAELSALQSTAPQEQTRNGIEQWPAASPDVATQSNDVQSADVQRSDGDQRRDMGEGQRPDTNAEASLPSAGDDLALRDEGPSVQALNPSINPQQEILSEPTSVEAQQAAPQGIEPQQMQADAASGITPWPDPGQPVTQAQTRAPLRTVPDDLLGMLNASGGISSSIRSDIDQDAKGRPGLYRASGRNIDEIGALMAEYGYIAPDEANDSAVVLETLRRAVGGERIMTAQGIERAQQKEEEARHRADLVAKATELGVTPRGKSIGKLESAIQQEIDRRESAFESRKQALIQESAEAEQAIEDVLDMFGSDSPSFRWMADKFAEISARETSDQRKSGYDSLVRAARQAIRKWQADQSRIESVIERSLEDGYGSQENPFGPSEGVAGQTEPVAAAESDGPSSVQSGDGRGQGFVLEAPTEQTLAEKVAREQDQALADKQTADAQREGFMLDAPTVPEVRTESNEKQLDIPRAEPSDSVTQRYPDIADVKGMDSGLGGIVEPRRIAEGKTLYREVGAGGLHDLLGLDGQAEIANFFVADNPDLALGQGGNKGVQVEFRPNSLSGAEHKKPGTGDISGREYRVDLRAPRAVQSVTLKASDLKLQRGIVRRVLASEFSRTDLPDGRIRFDRKGIDQSSSMPSHSRVSDKGKKGIDDFGDRLDGAKKFQMQRQLEALTDESIDIAKEPLSKTFPAPDYAKLSAEGVPHETLAFIALARNEIPAKPKVAYKLKRWSDQVKMLRQMSSNMLKNADYFENMRKIADQDTEFRAVRDLFLTAEAMKDVPPDQINKAAEWRLKARAGFSVYHGLNVRPSDTVYWLENSKGREAGIFGTDKADVIAKSGKAINDAVQANSENPTEKRYTRVSVYKDRYTKDHFIGFDGRDGVIRLKIGFESFKEAAEYIAERRDEIQSKIDDMRKGPQERRPDNFPRKGVERRNGDVTPEQFNAAYGFRGVQFGNYVEGDRRQAELNEAFDALMDMADVLGLPPKSLSLNGELGLAFGARGSGNAKAHYEPGNVVINITKTKGAGSLAHEWLHALDGYFNRQRSETGKDVGHITDREYYEHGNMRPEIMQAWADVMQAIKSDKGEFLSRAKGYDSARSKAYWSTNHELAARAFERYILDRINEQGGENDYLVNLYKEGGAYPTDKEMDEQGIRAAFDHLFETIETRETDRGTALFSRSQESKTQEQIARELFGNPNPKSTVEQVTKELSGEGSLGSNIKVIQSALDLPANERRQVFQSSSADIGLQAVFFPDSGRVYLIADNIEPGEALSALLHDGGVHAGLYGMIGERGINSLAAQIKDWARNSEGTEEGRIAKRALSLIPQTTADSHYNEEVVAYFITEAVKSGHGNPKPTKTNAVARWFARLWKMVEAAIQKLGADPASLKVDDIVALARGALERVKSGEIDPRRGQDDGPLPATITSQMEPLSEKAFYREYMQHRDLRGMRDGTSASNAERIRQEGFKSSFLNVLPATNGREPLDIVARAHMPKAGDTVYLVPRKFVKGGKIENGWKPGVGEVVTVERDNQPMYELYRKAFEPKQIKSSTGNSGNFDGSNPNILASRSYSPEQDAFRKKAGIGARPTIRQKIARWAEGMKDSLSWQAFRQGALDQFHGIKLAEVATIGALPVEQSAYVTSRLATGSSSVMAGLLGHGQAKWAANGQHLEKIEGTKGLLDILKPVEGQIDDFLGWMVANRASRLMKEGRENNFTEADIKAGLSLANGKEDLFKQVAKDFADFKRGVLDIAEQAGLIDPSGRKVWDHADWIPFYRQMQDDAVKGPGGKRGLSKQSSGIRQLKGGDSAINDPLENILLNFQHLIDASLKNNALRKVIGNVSGKTNSDEFLESVGYGMQGAMIPRDQIKKQLIAAGTPQQMIDALPAEALFGMAKMWSLKAPEGKDIIRVMENGKPHFYRVTDPLLLKAVTSFEPFNIPGLATMRAFKRLLTRSVTATPAFMVRNFVRDWFSSAIISRDSTNIISAMRGAVKSFSQEGGYEQMMFAGASFAGGQTDGADPEATAKAMRRELRKKGFSAASADEFMASILDRPIKMWDAYSKIGEAIENANREAMFEAAKRSGKSDTAAAFEALDLMDFRLRGSHAAYQMFADIIPFVNARVQGLYRLGRSNPKQVAIRGGLLLLIPSVLLALANAGNDEYEELPDWDKDTYWHFFIGGHHFRLPKPFEVGVMFGTLPERITRAMLGNDSPKKLASRVWFNIAEQFSLVQWPQFVKPAFEVAMNEDGFSKRAIETVGDKAVIPSMRASYYTSDTMKALAGVAPSVSDATGMSPKRMQHLWNGYLGSVGAAALSVSDFAVRRFQGLPFQEAMRRDEYPLLGVFYREAPAKNSGYVEEIYKMAKESSEWKKSYETAMKSGRADYAKQILADNKEKISMAGGLDHAASQMSGASKKIEAIRKDPALSANEKRDQIDAVIKRRNEIAEKVAKRAIKAWGGSI